VRQGKAYEVRLVGGLDLALVELVPVDLGEEGMVLDVLRTVQPASQTLLRVPV
jgi:hypothetical protein